MTIGEYDTFYERIKYKRTIGVPLFHREIQFLIDLVDSYGLDEGYWPSSCMKDMAWYKGVTSENW